MKAATAYERIGQVVVHASSKTTTGVWVLSEPIGTASKNDPEEVGRLVLASLNGSVRGLPHPKAWSNLFDPVLTLAGVKSMAAFVKAAKCVEIELDNRQVKFIPTRNGGAKDGFTPLPERTRYASEFSNQLGTELALAFASAE